MCCVVVGSFINFLLDIDSLGFKNNILGLLELHERAQHQQLRLWEDHWHCYPSGYLLVRGRLLTLKKEYIALELDLKDKIR